MKGLKAASEATGCKSCRNGCGRLLPRNYNSHVLKSVNYFQLKTIGKIPEMRDGKYIQAHCNGEIMRTGRPQSVAHKQHFSQKVLRINNTFPIFEP